MRSKAPEQKVQKVHVARIGAAHGVRGEVNLWSFTQDPAAVTDYGPLQTEDGSQLFEIESLRAAKDHFIVRFAGVTDRSSAEALRNLDLFVPRERLPKIEAPDTFYHTDLIGMKAVTFDGALIGTVTAMYNFGAGDIIEITPLSGGQTLMLSFTSALVPEIDMAARKIVVIPPTEVTIPPQTA